MNQSSDKDTKKRNLSDISQTSLTSPSMLPKKMLKVQNTSEDINILVEMEDTQSIHCQEDSKILKPVLEEKSMEQKVDEILSIVKANQVTTSLDINALQVENKNLQLRLSESEGTIARLSSKVKSLETKLENLQLHSMKPNLIFHNVPERDQEDCHREVDTLLRDVLKIPEDLLYSKNNLGGEIRVDVAHRIGQKRSNPRPLIAKFVTQRGRDVVFSYAKQLKSTPYALSEQLPPSTREKRSAQIPTLIELRKEARLHHKDSNIKLIKDKLLIDSKVNRDAFEVKPLDYTTSAGEPISFDHMLHSSVHRLRGSAFQGHLHPVHCEAEAIQSLRAILQNNLGSRSDHIIYAYNYTDFDGHTVSGYCDDGEWSAGVILKDLLQERNISNSILIVSRLHGGTNLGKTRFELIRKAATEVLNASKV